MRTWVGYRDSQLAPPTHQNRVPHPRRVFVFCAKGHCGPVNIWFVLGNSLSCAELPLFLCGVDLKLPRC